MKKKDKIKLFDRVYQKEKTYYGFDVDGEFVKFLEDNENLFKEKKALDLGCGEGRYALYLAKNGFDVTAIDFSSVAINKLKRIVDEQNLPIKSDVVDVSTYHFVPNSFELVVAVTIIDHLGKDVQEKVVNGIKCCLKKNGVAFIRVLTTEDPGYNKQSDNQVSETSGGIEYYFEKNELLNMFLDFQIIYYYEGTEHDYNHGPVHEHGWAILIAKK